MTRFEEIEQTVIGINSFPCTGTDKDGNEVIIEAGSDDNGRFYRLTTVQTNDWLRINTYYQDGTITETYKK